MNKSTWLILIAALLASGALVRLVLETRGTGPEQLLDSARARLEAAPPDIDRAFHELELALGRVTAEQQPELYLELVRERANVLMKRGASEGARRDLREVVALDPDDAISPLTQIASSLLRDKAYEEAAQVCDELFELNPNHRYGHEIKGRALQAQADEAFDRFRELVFNALPPTIAEERIGLAASIVHAEPEDPLRAASLTELEGLFDRETSHYIKEAEELIPEITEAYRRAREEHVAGTGQGVGGDTIESLTRSLFLTGRTTLAVDIGLASLTQSKAAGSPKSLEVLASALVEQGRPEAAADVIQVALPNTDETKLNKDFLPAWGRVLLEAEEWPRLAALGSELAQSPASMRDATERRNAGTFYAGLALVRIGASRDGEALLRGYTRGEPYEPIPGAIGLAWREIAELDRKSGRPKGELEALRRATDLDPDGSGEAWLRMVERYGDNPSAAFSAARALSHGIRLFPEREAELIPAWRGRGEVGLVERGIDIPLTIQRSDEQGVSYPTGQESAFVLLRIAETRFATGDSVRALEVAEHLSSLMPDFLPALDLRIRILDELQRQDERRELQLRRLELSPNNADVLASLRSEWESGALSPKHMLRLMLCDPAVTGRQTFLRQVLDFGRPDLVLRALEDLNDLEPGQSLPLATERSILLAAEAELQNGRPHLCLSRLESISPDSPHQAVALRLALDAAIALRDGRLLERTLVRFHKSTTENLPYAIAAGDELIRNGLVSQALTLFSFLDRQPDAWAGNDLAGSRTSSRLDPPGTWASGIHSTEPDELRANLLLRLALVHLIDGKAAPAAQALERAQAWFTDGSADLGRLLLAIQTGGWSGLPEYVRDLLDSEFEPSPLEDAVLAALEDRLDQAASQLAELDEESDDPLVTLARLAVGLLAGDPIDVPEDFGPKGAQQTLEMLRGQAKGADRRRDPRHALALILVLERLDWRLWIESSVPDAEFAPPGVLWLEYIAARSERVAGLGREAEGRLEELLKSFPGFEPAWDLLDQLLLERLGRLDHPDRIELLALRQVATGRAGAPGPEAGELKLARAMALAAGGDVQGALAVAEQVVAEHDDLLPARLIVARLHESLGDDRAALDDFTGFFDRADPELAAAYVDEFLALWAESTTDSRVRDEVLALELLEIKLPEEPKLALRLAELDIRATPLNPRLGVARAFDRLETFRSKNSDRALEPEAVAAWVEFYLRYDPYEAERFVSELLERDPRGLDLWLWRGRCYEAQGDSQRALDWYENIRAMVPETRVLRRVCEVYAELGSNHQEVERTVKQIRQLDKSPPDPTRLEFLRGKSLVNSAFSNIDRGLKVLGALWNRPDVGEPYLSREELGYVYASALIRGRAYDERKLAVEILDDQIEAETTDALRRAGLRALRNLADALPKPKGPEPASEPAANAPAPGTPAAEGQEAP